MKRYFYFHVELKILPRSVDIHIYPIHCIINTLLNVLFFQDLLFDFDIYVIQKIKKYTHIIYIITYNS